MSLRSTKGATVSHPCPLAEMVPSIAAIRQPGEAAGSSIPIYPPRTSTGDKCHAVTSVMYHAVYPKN